MRALNRAHMRGACPGIQARAFVFPPPIFGQDIWKTEPRKWIYFGCALHSKLDQLVIQEASNRKEKVRSRLDFLSHNGCVIH